MNRSLKGRIAALAILTAGPAAAADSQSVPFDAAHWTFKGEAAPVQQLNQPALRLREGSAVLKADVFATGVIEYDVQVPLDAVYTGLRFHGQDDGDYEYFYLRPDRSGYADSNQYTPVLHGDSGWQVYYGPEYSSTESYKFGGWNHVEVRIYPDSADVYVNGRRSLRIPELKGHWGSGFLALSSSPGSHNGADEAFYANFRYRPEPLARPADMPAPKAFSALGLVRQWRVSAPMSEPDASVSAAGGPGAGVGWTVLPPETNGLANLARLAAPTKGRSTVVARFEVTSAKAGSRLLRLGYSDKVKILVNGQPVFVGDATFLARDQQFLGTAGFHDAVAVPLKQGRNQIAFVVTEAYGGWAAGAWFEDPAGLSGPGLEPARP
jgi:hypothetical protein